MITEHRTGLEGDTPAGAVAVLNASNVGNLCTQPKRHKADSVMYKNAAIVTQKIRIAHMVRQGR
jgi:hypothetical protein